MLNFKYSMKLYEQPTVEEKLIRQSLVEFRYIKTKTNSLQYRSQPEHKIKTQQSKTNRVQ